MVGRCGQALRIKIFVVELGEDDPVKCTARKMILHGFACSVRRPPRGSIVLDPYADRVLSRLDARGVLEHGIVVVDASWNKLTAGRFERMASRWRRVERRRLPILFAANPPHYGRAFQLSSLEAVAAALYITGFEDDAQRLLMLYKWGPVFIELNRKLLDSYRECKEPACIEEVEADLLSKILGKRISASEVPSIVKALAERTANA